MSWIATAAVKGLTDNLTAREKLIMFLLSDYHNEHTGQCNPGHKRFATEALSSRRHLQRVLHSLEQKGFIVILRGGGRQSNQYLLTCLDPSSTGDTVSPVTSGGRTPCHPSPDIAVSPQPGHSCVTQTVIEPLSEQGTPSLSSSSKTTERGAHKEIDPDFLMDMKETFPAVDVLREIDKFLDWRTAKGRRFKDDRAAFRNWLRKAEEYAAERKSRDAAKAGRGAVRTAADLAEWDAYKRGVR